MLLNKFKWLVFSLLWCHHPLHLVSYHSSFHLLLHMLPFQDNHHIDSLAVAQSWIQGIGYGDSLPMALKCYFMFDRFPDEYGQFGSMLVASMTAGPQVNVFSLHLYL